MKSITLAEQEWGRPLRKVPGPPPSLFPDINHPNWAVVVTHSALGLRELFEKFQQGVVADTIQDTPTQKPVRPRLVADYEAGETVLRLSNTSKVKPGDVLELRCHREAQPIDESRPFSLVEELRRTGDLSESNDTKEQSNGIAGLETNTAKQSENNSKPPVDEQQTLLPWQN